MGYWNLMRVNPQTAQGAVVMSNTTRHWDITGFADDAIKAASPAAALGDAVTVRGGSRELRHKQMDSGRRSWQCRTGRCERTLEQELKIRLAS